MKPKQMWPGLISAGSKVSIRFVAMMTFTSPLESKPSNWFNSSNIVRWISLSPPEFESYLWKRSEGEVKIQLIFLLKGIIKHSSVSAYMSHPPNAQDKQHIIFFVAVFMPEIMWFTQSPQLSSSRAETHPHGCVARVRVVPCSERVLKAWLLTDQSTAG